LPKNASIKYLIVPVIAVALTIFTYSYMSAGALLFGSSFLPSLSGHVEANKAGSLFYQSLAEDSSIHQIIEYPAIVQDKFNPYPSYQHIHRKKLLYGYIQSHALKRQWTVPDVIRSNIWVLDVILSRLENNKINFSKIRHLLGNTVDLYDFAAIEKTRADYLILHKDIGREISINTHHEYSPDSPEGRMLSHAVRSVKHLAVHFSHYACKPVYEDKWITVFQLKQV